MEKIVILSASRTPIGSFLGSLSTLTATELGAVVIKETVQRSGINVQELDEVIMGNVLSAGLKQGPARQAMRLADIPDHVGATTINKICGSGMKAIMIAADAIKAKSAQLVIAGGMESMSNAPYLIDKARSGLRMGHKIMIDHMLNEGLEDAETNLSMGILAQEMADKKKYTREQQDEFAIRSLERAQLAIKNCETRGEITPVIIKNKFEEVTVSIDELPFKVNIEKITTLKPVFSRDGTITAANSSSISDGASAIAITSSEYAKLNKLSPIAEIKAYTNFSQHPSEFTLAPIGATKKILKLTGWNPQDVDLWEINEAFAVVSMLTIDAFALDPNKVNIYGGACALGHPLGSSGSRIIVTLLNALKQRGKKKGIAVLCIGGGEATAIAVELIE